MLQQYNVYENTNKSKTIKSKHMSMSIVNLSLYSVISCRISIALNTLISGEQRCL